MNKSTLIILVVILLLILGGGGFMLLNRSQTNPEPPVVKPKSNASTMDKKSLRDLMSLSGNQQCTFSDKETGDLGAVYSSGGKVRGDFKSETNGKSTGSHMIQDGTNIYFWMDGEKSGYKASLDTVTKTGEDVMEKYQSQSKSPAVDLKKQVDYSCSGWGGDAAKFAVPTNVEFTDYTKVMEEAGKMIEQSGISNQDACSACDSLTGETQAQCKAALKCS